MHCLVLWVPIFLLPVNKVGGGAVMFSVMSVCPWGGGVCKSPQIYPWAPCHILHLTLQGPFLTDMGLQCIETPLKIWDLAEQEPPLNMGFHCTEPTANGIWLASLETYSNLFTSTTSHYYWLLVVAIKASTVGMCSFFTALQPYFSLICRLLFLLYLCQGVDRIRSFS